MQKFNFRVLNNLISRSYTYICHLEPTLLMYSKRAINKSVSSYFLLSLRLEYEIRINT